MDIKNIAKWKIIVGIWALLIIPFYVANSMFFPYISGKNFAFRIIVELIFATWAYLAFIDVKYRPKLSWVAIATGAFVLIMAIADFFSINPAKAFWSNFERMDGWVTLIHLFMFLLVAGSVMKTEKIWLWFFRSSLISSVIMMVLVSQDIFKNHPDRVSVTLGNPIYLAIYFLFNFFFALILVYKDVIVKKVESKKQFLEISKTPLTYVYLILAVLCVWGIWVTGTRGVVLGLIGGLFVSSILIAVFEKKNKLMRNTAIGGLITIIILISGFFAIRDTQFAKNNFMLSRFASISWKDIKGQGQARQYVWAMALKGFQEKPILGWGQDGFNNVFNKYYDVRMYDQEQWFDRAHNTPLDVLIAGGILGLVSYLGIFVAALWLIWKRRNKLGIIDSALLVGVLAAYFFQNLFVFDNLSSYILFFIVLAYLHASDTEGNEISHKVKDGERMGVSSDLANYVVLPLIIVTLGVSIWYLNYKPIIANLSLIKSMGQQKEGLNKNLELFKNALAQNTFANPEILEQLLSITPRVASMNVDQKIKQDFVNLALSQAEKQIKQTPNDARYQFFVGGFLSSLQQYEMALPYLEKAVELSPNKLTMLFELTNCLSNLGQNAKALEIAKKAYDLVPTYEEGKMNYISVLIRNGREADAKKLLGTTTTNSEKVVRAYLLNASDFLKVGNKNSAVMEVQKAMKIAPGFEDQGKEVIDGIWKGTIK